MLISGGRPALLDAPKGGQDVRATGIIRMMTLAVALVLIAGGILAIGRGLFTVTAF